MNKNIFVLLLSVLFINGHGQANVPTTVNRTIVPDADRPDKTLANPYPVSAYSGHGYGTWQYGPGSGYVRKLDLMPASYTGAPAASHTQLLRFFTITDIHITDKESPAQAIYMGKNSFNPSAYSGVMLYTPHVLNAAIKTINALHQENAFDFGISLGDTCNATQLNELRWYIDVIDGNPITPSSGNHAGADTIDYQMPFEATGLNKSINWYQVLGNHDHFWLGFLPANNYIKRTLIGRNILNLGNPFIDPLGGDSRGFYMGSIDGSTPYGDIFGAGPIADFQNPPTIPAADGNRRSLSRQEWIGEFFKTSSNPIGHGFSCANKTTGFACYTFKPKANVPLKVIVLDDTQRDDDPNDPIALGYGAGSFGYGHGALDAERYNWLVSELDKGQRENKLMIIAAHIPIGVEPAPSMMCWNPDLEQKLIAKLHTYPNLLLWIAGHRHINTITAFKSPDDSRPELGFWQVETASLRDFPQQLRSFEIIRNSDNTISIFTTNIDPVVETGSPANTSRTYAVAVQQILTSKDPGSYNAELIKKLPPLPSRRAWGSTSPRA